MTIETHTFLGIEAHTDAGSGLLVPIAKALSHLSIVHAAIHREWPLTAESASAEITEAVTHLESISIDRNLLTEELNAELNVWTAKLTVEGIDLTRQVFANQEAPLSEGSIEAIRALISITWRLLALIDREITGISNADPGTQP